jgi:hypothetical protein
MKRHELKGMAFGRLTAIEFVRTHRARPNGRIENDGKWLCTCACGMTTMAAATDLLKGKVRSCGCLHDEVASKNATTHGYSGKERLYTIWVAMKQRCYYNKAQHRENYSMKGITVCDEWKEDYLAFREWAYSNGYYEQPKDTPHGQVLSIDRIDPNGNYCPDNCQWISCDANLRKRFADEKRAQCL